MGRAKPRNGTAGAKKTKKSKYFVNIIECFCIILW